MTCNVVFRKSMPSLHYELQTCIRMKATERIENMFGSRAAINISVWEEHVSGCQDEWSRAGTGNWGKGWGRWQFGLGLSSSSSKAPSPLQSRDKVKYLWISDLRKRDSWEINCSLKYNLWILGFSIDNNKRLK